MGRAEARAGVCDIIDGVPPSTRGSGRAVNEQTLSHCRRVHPSVAESITTETRRARNRLTILSRIRGSRNFTRGAVVVLLVGHPKTPFSVLAVPLWCLVCATGGFNSAQLAIREPDDAWRSANDQSSPHAESRTSPAAAGVRVSGLGIDWSLGLGHSPLCPRSRADSEARPVQLVTALRPGSSSGFAHPRGSSCA